MGHTHRFLPLGHVAPADLPALLGTAFLGLLMFGALGYLLGGVMPGVDSATHVGTFVQVGSMLLCLVFLPTGMLPDGVATVVGHLPPTYFADLLLATTPYWKPLHPTWLSVVVVLGTAVALTACAVALFRWDQGGRR